jgi:hypothetical protein
MSAFMTAHFGRFEFILAMAHPSQWLILAH